MLVNLKFIFQVHSKPLIPPLLMLLDSGYWMLIGEQNIYYIKIYSYFLLLQRGDRKVVCLV